MIFARCGREPAMSGVRNRGVNGLGGAPWGMHGCLFYETKQDQLEPVWGGSSDTAGTLRATCALALVQCRSLVDSDLLAHLVELLADKDKAVRAEAVRAIEQVGSSSASLLLRLRAVLDADEPEVLGACYSGILRIEGVSVI